AKISRRKIPFLRAKDFPVSSTDPCSSVFIGGFTLSCLRGRNSVYKHAASCRVQLEVGVRLPRDARKRRTNNESDMECGDLSPLSCRRRAHSGDKSPHSKRAVIVRLQLTKAAPEATPPSNCTSSKPNG